jgi:hypothetical protein
MRITRGDGLEFWAQPEPLNPRHDRARFWIVFGVTLAIAILSIVIGGALRPAAASPSRNSVSLDNIVAPLATKARAIMASCGAKVVSSVRIGARVFGGNASNHASGRAVDLQGNPKCIYAQLSDWPGGVSTDYWIAPGGPHVHVSYNPGGMEWGLRFRHHQPRRRR